MDDIMPEYEVFLYGESVGCSTNATPIDAIKHFMAKEDIDYAQLVKVQWPRTQTEIQSALFCHCELVDGKLTYHDCA